MKRSNRPGLPTLAGVAIGVAALLSAAPALAFCRTSSCAPPGGPQETGAVCSPAQPSDCGKPLFWPTLCVSYSLQKDASKKGVSLEVEKEAFRKAFASWTSANCKGGTPRIRVEELEPVSCKSQEYNQKVGNANSFMFRDDEWPYAGSSNVLALTTVTYNLENGEIYDADMELNSADIHFTTSDTKVEFDLLSVITHETGHFLGLSHSTNPAATMFAAYKPGDISLRDLDDDDRAGICDIYPPGQEIPGDCDVTPRHGFSTLCGDEQDGPGQALGGCCAVAPGAASPGGSAASAAAALGAILLLGRRRHHAASRKGQGG
jgi:hypothetical protein